LVRLLLGKWRVKKEYKRVMQACQIGPPQGLDESMLKTGALLGDADHLARQWSTRPLYERFLQIVEQYPRKTALADGDAALSYRELAALATDMAARLAARDLQGQPVCIALPAGNDFIAAMLGCLAAGCPYVPLDMSFPPERNRHIIAHSQPAAIIGAGGAVELAPELPLLSPPTHADLAFRSFGATADSVAHIIYTSGSTGLPKGIYQSQRNLMGDALRYAAIAGIEASDEMTLLYSPSVNGSMRDIYGALLTGATLHILNLRRRGLTYARNVLLGSSLSIYHSIPPVLRAILRDMEPHQIMPSVRFIYLSGDSLLRQDVEACRHHMPNALIYTGLGSSEVTTAYTEWFVPLQAAGLPEIVPVGYPSSNLVAQVMDEHGAVLAPGSVGELVVAGSVLGLGYWRASESQLAIFGPDPQHPDWRRYRTGDMVRADADGLLHYLGRKGREVKINGYRVEPVQVEAVLRGVAGVHDAVVVPRRVGTHTELVAFVTPAEVLVASLQAACRQSLPGFMQPARIRLLEAMPKLANFKPDLKTLDALLGDEAVQVMPAQTADGFLQAVVERAWQEALGEPVAGPEQSWRDSGGDSLRAVILLAKLEKALGRRIPPETLLPDMTVAWLTACLENQAETDAPGAAGVRVFMAPGLDDGVNLPFNTLIHNLRQCCDVTLLPYDTGDARSVNDLGFEAIIQRTLLLIAGAGSQPVHLAGYSYGARIAFELACRLGHERVASLTLLDMSTRYGRGAPSGGLWQQLLHWLSPSVPLYYTRKIFSRALVFRLARLYGSIGGLGALEPIWRRQYRRQRRSPFSLYLGNLIRMKTAPVMNRNYEGGHIHLLRTDNVAWRGCSDALGWEERCATVAVHWLRGGKHEEVPVHPQLMPVLQAILQLPPNAVVGHQPPAG
jgi:amino acid adenylation domain-containing protein